MPFVRTRHTHTKRKKTLSDKTTQVCMSSPICAPVVRHTCICIYTVLKEFVTLRGSANTRKNFCTSSFSPLPEFAPEMVPFFVSQPCSSRSVIRPSRSVSTRRNWSSRFWQPQTPTHRHTRHLRLPTRVFRTDLLVLDNRLQCASCWSESHSETLEWDRIGVYALNVRL